MNYENHNNEENKMNSSTQDKVKGTFNSYAGAAKETAGKIFENKDVENKGFAQKLQGKSEELQGKIKERIQKGTQAVGDAIEKVGDKIEHMADKL